MGKIDTLRFPSRLVRHFLSSRGYHGTRFLGRNRPPHFLMANRNHVFHFFTFCAFHIFMFFMICTFYESPFFDQSDVCVLNVIRPYLYYRGENDMCGGFSSHQMSGRFIGRCYFITLVLPSLNRFLGFIFG